MDADEEEEDIINANSPLFMYMQDMGIPQDVLNPQSHERPATPNESNNNFHDSDTMFTTPRFFKIGLFIKNFQNILAKKLSGTKYFNILSTFENSGVILEEDTKMISFVAREFTDLSQKSGSLHDILWCHQWILHFSLLFISICFAFFRLEVAFFGAFIFVLIFILLVVHPIFEYVHRYNRLAHSILQLIKALESHDALIRKMILFIQEADIVSRGFVFVSAPASNTLKSSKTEMTRRFPQLRKKMFFALRHIVYRLRAGTKDLCAVLPPSREYLYEQEAEDVMHCIADIPLDEFGPCLSLADTEEQEICECSDNYSTPALRAMSQLVGMHASELLRKTCVLSQPRRLLDLDDFYTKEFTRITVYLQSFIDSSESSMKKQFELNQFCVNTNSDSTEEDVETKIHNIMDASRKKLYTSVHSLSLHFQAALTKVFEMEKILDKQENQCDRVEPEELDCLLRVIGSELEACGICLEESFTRLNGESKAGSSTDTKVKMPVTKSSDDGIEVTLICEPVIEDEVLEAMAEESDGEEMKDDDNREVQEVNSVEAQKVLSELRSVISVRAEEWKSRERRAKRRQLGLPESGGSDEEEEEEATSPLEVLDSEREEARRAQIEAREMMSKKLSETSSLREGWSAMAAAIGGGDGTLAAGEECFGDSDSDSETE